jgi:hypothetical protein
LLAALRQRNSLWIYSDCIELRNVQHFRDFVVVARDKSGGYGKKTKSLH